MTRLDRKVWTGLLLFGVMILRCNCISFCYQAKARCVKEDAVSGYSLVLSEWVT